MENEAAPTGRQLFDARVQMKNKFKMAVIFATRLNGEPNHPIVNLALQFGREFEARRDKMRRLGRGEVVVAVSDSESSAVEVINVTSKNKAKAKERGQPKERGGKKGGEGVWGPGDARRGKASRGGASRVQVPALAAAVEEELPVPLFYPVEQSDEMGGEVQGFSLHKPLFSPQSSSPRPHPGP